MAEKPRAVKFFAIAWYQSGDQLSRAEKRLRKLGKIDYVSGAMKMPRVDEFLLYQRQELAYSYRIYSYYRLIQPHQLVDLAKKTAGCRNTDLLQKASPNNRFSRFYQITAGYLSLPSVVTAREEESFGRVSLFHGYFAQPEYVYESKQYRPLEFANIEMIQQPTLEFFLQLRIIYKKQLMQRYNLKEEP